VHVWRAGLDVSSELLQRLGASLAPDERERAARFHFQKDRERFATARGILRDILGRYLGASAAALAFHYGGTGKPALEGYPEPRFNVSHSDGLALYAFAIGRDVGIDVELIRPGLSEERIAERFFSSSEVDSLRSMPKERQNEAFFRLWTRKEAYVKGVGMGLAIPLSSFAADDVPGWEIQDLSPGPRFCAALAVQGAGWSVRQFDWEAAESRVAT